MPAANARTMAAGAIGGHRRHRTQDTGGSTGHGFAPIVDHLFDRRQLTGEGEPEVRTQRGVLGDGDRVVGPGAVHHRRRQQHHVTHAVFRCHGQQLGCSDRRASTSGRQRVVVTRSQMNENVDRPCDGVLSALNLGDRESPGGRQTLDDLVDPALHQRGHAGDGVVACLFHWLVD